MKKLEGEHQSNVRFHTRFVGLQTILLLIMLSRWNLTVRFDFEAPNKLTSVLTIKNWRIIDQLLHKSTDVEF